MAARSWAKRHRLCVHHRVPHAVRRVYQGADAACRCGRSMPGCGASTAPAQGTMVATPVAARRTDGARLPQHPVVVARRRSGRCSSRSRARTGTCRARCSSMSAAWRWRRTSARSSISICRDRRSWWAAGRSLRALRRDYPNVLFTGPRYGEALARAYAGADVFVFPSLTDTFGLVMLEALACGTPVAAFPVTGPKDVLADAQRQDRCGECRSAGGGAGGAGARTARPAGRMRNAIRGARAPRCSCRIWCRWRVLLRAAWLAGFVRSGCQTLSALSQSAAAWDAVAEMAIHASSGLADETALARSLHL